MELIAGIVIGAVFAPFWMMVGGWVKTLVLSKMNKTPPAQ